MRAVVTVFFRWLANCWSILTIVIILFWVIVAHELYPLDPKWIALGYFPPFWFILLLVPPAILFLLLRLFRRTALLAVIYLAFFLGFGDISFIRNPAFEFPGDSQTRKISIIALNLRYYSFGFEEIVDAVNEMDADLYLLSENEIAAEQIIALKKRIAPKSFYMGQQESTAVISRYPVVEFKEVKFPTRQASLFDGNSIEDLKDNPFRSFVHAVVDIEGTPVHVISVRFIAGRAANRQFDNVIRWGFHVFDAQQKEMAFFLDYLKELKEPVIFGGDLNATPRSIVIRKLSEVSTDLYLQDHIWGGTTFGTPFPPRTNLPTARLDYIFGMNQVQPLRSEKLDIVISDHYPVLAECLIPAGQPE